MQAKIKELHYTGNWKIAIVTQNTNVRLPHPHLRKWTRTGSHQHHFVPVA